MSQAGHPPPPRSRKQPSSLSMSRSPSPSLPWSLRWVQDLCVDKTDSAESDELDSVEWGLPVSRESAWGAKLLQMNSCRAPMLHQ